MNCSAEAGGRKYFFLQYLLLFAVLIFCIYQYGIHRLYGFSVYPDEFGYWASAAGWIGYDWSGVVSLGPYYSFGYSLILAPILRLCEDSVHAYRVAVTVNMLLHCISIGLLWGILKRLYCQMDGNEEEMFGKKVRVVFAVGVAVFYPAWTFYMQMTMTESLLAFLFVFICYQFVLLWEKPKMIRVMLLSLSFFYLYFVHMRTVGVVIAAVLVLLFCAWRMPAYRRILLIGMAVLLMGAGVGIWLKGIVTDTVYAVTDEKLMVINDYAGQLRGFKALFTVRGMLQLFQSCIGKLYYMGMASYGLVYPAIWLCIKRTIHLKDEASGRNVIYPFLLLAMLGQLMVSAIFMKSPGRLDGVVYGRYNDYLLPIFIGIGILALFESKKPFRIWGICAGISTVLFGITLWTVLQREAKDSYYGFFATGISYLWGDMYDFRVLPEFVKAYLFGLFLMALMMGCIYMGGRLRQNALITGIALLIEILLTLCLSTKYTWFFNDIDYYDLKVYEYIEEYEAAEYGKEGTTIGADGGVAETIGVPVSYLYGGGLPYVDLIQFAMRDKTIAILSESDASGAKLSWEALEPALPEEGFLLVDSGSGYLEELEEKYERCVESSSFVLFMGR